MSDELTDAEGKLIIQAMGFTPDPPSKKSNADRAHGACGEARAALRNAEIASRHKDHAAAKRWADTAKRMADVAARLAAMPMSQPSWEEEEAIRTELRERLAKVCTDGEALRRWQVRREIWEEMATEARRTGAPMPQPMPPRPPHWADRLPEELRCRMQGAE